LLRVNVRCSLRFGERSLEVYSADLQRTFFLFAARDCIPRCAQTRAQAKLTMIFLFNLPILTVLMYLGISFLAACFLFARMFSFARATRRQAQSVHDNALTNILGATTRYFDSTPQGRIMDAFAKDIMFVDRR
jgi:ABC-type multidrug transport system fused ATPase/permease subunit